jgi:protoporphyrinogen oxidase
MGMGMHVGIIGGGFTGLAAALELARSGARVTIVESDSTLGGLAGGFDVGGINLEKFYHHWFTSDRFVMDMIEEIGCGDSIVLRPTRTGLYYANSIFRLSSPLDLLKFNPLSLVNRIRLGLLVFKARAVKDWRELEGLTAKEWLIQMCGKEVFRVVWEPLLKGKFGPYAEEVSAVWFWKKIALRGGSRSENGKEVLAYFKGGFAKLADSVGTELEKAGVRILRNTAVTGLRMQDGRVAALETSAGAIEVDSVIATPSLPIIAGLLDGHAPSSYVAQLRSVKYLANVCLVLELSHSLSDTYWLNVNDPSFPFVGVIEHTNFEPPQSYGGRHVVYLSKYLPEDDRLYAMGPDELLAFAIPHIERMFPNFKREWIKNSHVWKAAYAQPIMERHYSKKMPARQTPIPNLFISTMAQVYPEDRGTNYAIREGRATAGEVLKVAPVPKVAEPLAA